MNDVNKPYSVPIFGSEDRCREMETWCIANIEQVDGSATWDWHWTAAWHRAFYFDNEKDAMMFALRWL